MKNDIVFEFLNSINETKKNIMNDYNERFYNAYFINHFLADSIDTVLFANEMNYRPHLDRKLQYDFLRYSIPKKRRYLKWPKQEKISDINLIKHHYKYNSIKAKDAVQLLTDKQINEIKTYYDKGSINKK